MVYYEHHRLSCPKRVNLKKKALKTFFIINNQRIVDNINQSSIGIPSFYTLFQTLCKLSSAVCCKTYVRLRSSRQLSFDTIQVDGGRPISSRRLISFTGVI